nr:hypothetical protein [Tanacetum cinerariifolium]
MDGDDWDVEEVWLMALVTPPRATMTAPSTYEVGGPSTTPTEGPSFPLPVPGLPVPPIVIEDLASPLGRSTLECCCGGTGTSGESTDGMSRYRLCRQHYTKPSRKTNSYRRVAKLESHMGIVMPYMLWMEERLTALEKRPPRPPLGPQ